MEGRRMGMNSIRSHHEMGREGTVSGWSLFDCIFHRNISMKERPIKKRTKPFTASFWLLRREYYGGEGLLEKEKEEEEREKTLSRGRSEDWDWQEWRWWWWLEEGRLWRRSQEIREEKKCTTDQSEGIIKKGRGTMQEEGNLDWVKIILSGLEQMNGSTELTSRQCLLENRILRETSMCFS